MGRPHDWRTKISDAKAMTDDELKDLMLQCLVMGTTYSIKFRDAPSMKVRCWFLLASEPEFKKKYEEMLMMHISVAEERLLTGEFLENLPQTVDKLGNVDIARGALRKAELDMKRMQWVLERRDKKYQSKIQQDITSNGEALNAIVLPAKLPKEDS